MLTVSSSIVEKAWMCFRKFIVTVRRCVFRYMNGLVPKTFPVKRATGRNVRPKNGAGPFSRNLPHSIVRCAVES
eukprot:5858526-Pyramimonas_sp.AAC.1